ncbi:Hypothetical_protein [Hexamita inflata]|uniref:Hypothetical_protein n=1 Tax=Hexamita inflata TaxID=28002 RepID=A0AA86UV65_9EUKA|nr:Hypothetical protein HINF_LOCUS60675 [Hexamita inflata]
MKLLFMRRSYIELSFSRTSREITRLKLKLKQVRFIILAIQSIFVIQFWLTSSLYNFINSERHLILDKSHQDSRSSCNYLSFYNGQILFSLFLLKSNSINSYNITTAETSSKLFWDRSRFVRLISEAIASMFDIWFILNVSSVNCVIFYIPQRFRMLQLVAINFFNIFVGQRQKEILAHYAIYRESTPINQEKYILVSSQSFTIVNSPFQT